MTNEEVKRLISIILKSGVRAFNRHYKMSGGEWVHQTPEYWYTCQIAEAIGVEFPNYCVALENSVSDFRDHATSRAGRPTKRFNSGRTDISIWKYWKGEDAYTAKCLIEIKRGWGWSAKAMGEDIDRLRASLTETEEINDAFFVVITDDEDRFNQPLDKALIERSETIKDNIVNHLGNHPISVKEDHKLSKFYEDDNSRAAVFVYKLRYDGRKDK